MEKRQIYPNVDLCKLICAIAIVFTHTYCFDMGHLGRWIKDNISVIGVPFFFIASGYFFMDGMLANNDTSTYFRKYIARNSMIYIAWTFITAPISWMNVRMAHPTWNLFLKIVSLFRSFFLVGSLGVYWYLHSLIISGCILYWAYRQKKNGAVYLLSIIGFIMGVLYSGGKLAGTPLYTCIHVLFGSERNVFNVGLVYMAIGFFIRSENRKCDYRLSLLLLMLSVAVGTVLNKYTPYRFMQAFSAIALFLFAMNSPASITHEVGMVFRRLSTIIYLVHFPFILVFDYYLKRGTFVDFGVTLGFSGICYMIFVYAIPKKWSLVLIGK